jgi:hypothetical protein
MLLGQVDAAFERRVRVSFSATSLCYFSFFVAVRMPRIVDFFSLDNILPWVG